jgi:uncharacterized protein
MTSASPSLAPSVLLAFRAENVRSFRDQVHISSLGTAMAEPNYVRHVAWREGGHPVAVNAVLALFGANGSGKSNVIKAMDDMRFLVLHSFRWSPSRRIPRNPFLLGGEEQRAKPSVFEIDLVLQGVRWEYGFAVDDQSVVEEWAYYYPRGRQATVFHRTHGDLRVGAVERAKSRAIREVLRANALFLSTAAAANHEALSHLFEWFERNLLLAEADTRPFRQAYTAKLLEDDALRPAVLELLRAADLGIAGAHALEPDPVLRERLAKAVEVLMGEDFEGEAEPPEFGELNVRLDHRSADGEIVSLPAEDESLGTRVWFGIVGPAIMALREGCVFLADELDASLHPLLVAHLVKLFQDEETNPKRAQLVFNSHDAWLLGDGTHDRLLGRDQIWLCEKDEGGSSRVFPLVDMAPRKNEALGQRYLAGRYGGTPILSHEEFTAAAELIPSSSN